MYRIMSDEFNSQDLLPLRFSGGHSLAHTANAKTAAPKMPAITTLSTLTCAAAPVAVAAALPLPVAVVPDAPADVVPVKVVLTLTVPVGPDTAPVPVAVALLSAVELASAALGATLYSPLLPWKQRSATSVACVQFS